MSLIRVYKTIIDADEDVSRSYDLVERKLCIIMNAPIIIFFLAFVLLTISPDSVKAEEECGLNEERTPCGPVCEPSCSVPNPTICMLSCIINGCECKEGFFRHDETKQCVRMQSCPRADHIFVAEHTCGENQSPAPCGPVCEPTCVNPKPKICSNVCVPNGCRCDEGFVRNRFHQCVPYPIGCYARRG